MPAAELLGRDRDAGEDYRELGGDGAERVGDAPLGDSTVDVDERSKAAPDRATDGDLGGREDGDGDVGDVPVVLAGAAVADPERIEFTPRQCERDQRSVAASSCWIEGRAVTRGQQRAGVR